MKNKDYSVEQDVIVDTDVYRVMESTIMKLMSKLENWNFKLWTRSSNYECGGYSIVINNVAIMINIIEPYITLDIYIPAIKTKSRFIIERCLKDDEIQNINTLDDLEMLLKDTVKEFKINIDLNKSDILSEKNSVEELEIIKQLVKTYYAE